MKALLWAAAAGALLIGAACASQDVVGYTRHGRPVVCNDNGSGCYVARRHRPVAVAPVAPPPGYGAVGQVLAPGEAGPEVDWRALRLKDPGQGRRWVRVRDAAVLVDAEGRVWARKGHVFQ